MRTFYYIFLGFTVLLVVLIIFDTNTCYVSSIGIVQVLMWMSLLMHTIFESKNKKNKTVGYYFILFLIVIVLLLTVYNVIRLHFIN